jgi:two-component system phosphate regulon response regulator PhoB
MSKTILIAEDDTDLRTLLFTVFNSAGYTVYTARNGHDAIRLMRENGFPDVLLVDYHMPGKTGVEIIEEVRQREKERRVVAILITATHMRSSDDVQEGLALADLMIGKPFNYKQLLGTVERLTSQ